MFFVKLTPIWDASFDLEFWNFIFFYNCCWKSLIQTASLCLQVVNPVLKKEDTNVVIFALEDDDLHIRA